MTDFYVWHELDRELQSHWMQLPEEQRFLTTAGLYETEKQILTMLAPNQFTKKEKLEFVFYHMHGYPMPQRSKKDE